MNSGFDQSKKKKHKFISDKKNHLFFLRTGYNKNFVGTGSVETGEEGRNPQYTLHTINTSLQSKRTKKLTLYT